MTDDIFTFSQEDEQSAKNYQQTMDEAAERLETKYADRGLKFTVPFSGMVPVQAFGHIDGNRFYFRFRYDRGMLKIGPVDEELDKALAVAEEKRRQEKLAKINANDVFSSLGLGREKPAQTGEDDYYYPNRVTTFSSIADYSGEPYLGALTKEMAVDLFSKLVEALEPVESDPEISEENA